MDTFYVNHTIAAVLASAEEKKKRKYLSVAELRHASFTPFVVSVDGALGYEALMFLRCLAERLVGWGKSYGHVLMWIWVRLAFAAIHSSCVRWRSATSIDIGAGLPDVSLACCNLICDFILRGHDYDHLI